MSRVALVTGAARGIGAATVRQLLLEGWEVVAVDSVADDARLPYALGTPAGLEGAAALGAVPVVADATDETALSAAVALAEERFGGLDVAISAAGVIAGGVPLWEQPLAEVRAVLDVDLYGPIALARVAVPALLRRPAPRSGRYLAVVSAAATRGLPMLSAYCAAKAGVTGLIRALAVELAAHGVTANGVSPGSTDTAILTESARLYGLPGGQAFAAQQPLERLLEPAEIARVLVWLAGADTGAITGVVLPVDGGLGL
ncbi:MAG: short-chain dehydrogenase/reductase [Frankiales bacterium]|nr:short-chain dehydrogenase/reductase [Frankiales bacterium]